MSQLTPLATLYSTEPSDLFDRSELLIQTLGVLYLYYGEVRDASFYQQALQVGAFLFKKKIPLPQPLHDFMTEGLSLIGGGVNADKAFRFEKNRNRPPELDWWDFTHDFIKGFIEGEEDDFKKYQKAWFKKYRQKHPAINRTTFRTAFKREFLKVGGVLDLIIFEIQLNEKKSPVSYSQ